MAEYDVLQSLRVLDLAAVGAEEARILENADVHMVKVVVVKIEEAVKLRDLLLMGKIDNGRKALREVLTRTGA